MRLLSVIHGPAFGGAHNQALVLAEPLRRRGVETVVVLPEEAGAAAERLRSAGLEAITIPLRRMRATPAPTTQARFVASVFQDVKRLRNLISEHAADVVQVHGPVNPQAALAARAEGAGVVWQILDTRAPMTLRRIMMPWMRRLADVITVWGIELGRVHPGAERLGERLIPVFPPVDARLFEPDPDARRQARRELGVGDEQILVGSLGVLNPQKGHEYTVRAAAKVVKVHPDARFRILGTTSPAHARYERGLRQEAAALGIQPGDRLKIVDPADRVASLIQAFDIFLLASVPRSEGMPTAILEAMVCAKPVIATDVGAVRELVDHNVTGLIVPSERPDSLASAVSSLIREPARAAAMGAAGRRRALAKFDLDRLTDLHLRAYRLAVSSRAAA